MYLLLCGTWFKNLAVNDRMDYCAYKIFCSSFVLRTWIFARMDWNKIPTIIVALYIGRLCVMPNISCIRVATDNYRWWQWWIIFVEWLSYERRQALFLAGNTVRGSLHHKPLAMSYFVISSAMRKWVFLLSRHLLIWPSQQLCLTYWLVTVLNANSQ